MNEPQARGLGTAARLVDLHAHSTASDGAATPLALVARARDAGLAAVALTDHDTLGGIGEARKEAERLGIRLVAGVELSALDGDREIHVLGLHLARTEALDERLAAFRVARYTRAEQIVARLHMLGAPVSFDAVLRHAAGGAIGRPHVARALVEGNWARDTRDAFDRYLGAGRPAFVPKQRLSVGDAIDLVHRAGGLAVLAHPGVDGRRDFVEQLVALGLDGLEVRHPGHTAEDVARLGALVDHFGLVPSGGSDWHGATAGPRVLGSMGIPEAWLHAQDERVATLRARERVA